MTERVVKSYNYSNNPQGNILTTTTGTSNTLVVRDTDGSIQVAESYKLSGSTSGTISIIAQPAAGTYNFNLPTSLGGAGTVLTSAGPSSPMTWASVGTVTSVASTAGTSGLTITVSTPSPNPSLSITGILAVTNGGTGSATSTGTGAVVLASSPTLVTPVLGAANATSITLSSSLYISGGTGNIQIYSSGGTGYNFILPQTVGEAGSYLTSQAGATHMTWSPIPYSARFYGGTTFPTMSGNTTVVFANLNGGANTGSAYNTSTGVFTAPVIGVYSITGVVSFTTGLTWLASDFFEVGYITTGTAQGSGTYLLTSFIKSPINGSTVYNYSFTLNMTATSDTVKIFVTSTNTAQGGLYNDGTSTTYTNQIQIYGL